MAMLAGIEKQTDLPDHGACFACGQEHPDGLHLCFVAGGDGVVRAGWMPQAGLRSYPDRVHGGILATVADSAMVHALATMGVAGVTAEMSLRYLHAVVPGIRVEVEARVDRVRHGVYFCEAELRQNQHVAVRAAAKFIRMES